MSFSLINNYALNICYIKDRENRHSLIIPNKQMEDFMFLLDFSPESIELVNKNLKHGDRVRVIKGPLTGLEGELLRIKGHKRSDRTIGRSCLYRNFLYSGIFFGEN